MDALVMATYDLLFLERKLTELKLKMYLDCF